MYYFLNIVYYLCDRLLKRSFYYGKSNKRRNKQLKWENGKPVYIGYKGKVHDATNSFLW